MPSNHRFRRANASTVSSYLVYTLLCGVKAYHLCREINTWPKLMMALEENFGADDHSSS
jgi:hypothetical protein